MRYSLLFVAVVSAGSANAFILDTSLSDGPVAVAHKLNALPSPPPALRMAYSLNAQLAKQVGDPGWAKGLALAKEGQDAEALAQMEILIQKNPETVRYAYDYISLATRFGLPDRALSAAPLIDLQAAPAYVLESLAVSYWKAGNLAKAEQVWSVVLSRFAGRSQAVVGWAYFLGATDRVPEAITVLNEFLAADATSLPAWEALAWAYKRQGLYTEALRAYQEFERRGGNTKIALRGRVSSMTFAGASVSANALLDKVELPVNELSDIKKRQGVSRIRFTENTEQDKYAKEGLADLAEAWGADPQDAIQDDRIVGLVVLKKFETAISTYNTLYHGEGGPWYVRMAVAQAYENLDKPEQAIDLYKTVVADKPKHYAPLRGLITSLVSAERHDEAMAAADRLVQQTPIMSYQDVKALARPNPEYPEARVIKAMTRAYADDLKEADRQMTILRDEAPAEDQIVASHATVKYWRGNLFEPEDELRGLLTDQPSYDQAKYVLANILYDKGDIPGYLKLVGELAAKYPDTKQTHEMLRQEEARRAALWRTEVVWSQGGINGTGRELALDTRVYNKLDEEGLRYFTGVRYGTQSDLNYSGQWGYAGFEKRLPYVTWEGGAYAGSHNPGLWLSRRQRLDDAWSIAVRGDLNSMALPIKALNDNVSGSSVEASVAWQDQEQRKAVLGGRALQYSDGNLSLSQHLAYTELLSVGPRHRLNATLNLAHDSNSKQNVAYFSPENATYYGLTLDWQGLQYRFKEKSIWHKISGSFGRVYQAGYGSLLSNSIYYEYDHQVDLFTQFRVGIGRSIAPYDGVREGRNWIMFSVEHKF